MNPSRFRDFLRWLTLGLLTSILVVPATPTRAATFTVTNVLDSGTGSLRQAIIDANTAVGADTITFAGGVTGTITLSSDLPEIADDLTVTGPGQLVLTIDGAGLYRPFWIRAGKSFTISNLTLRRGRNLYERGSLIHNQEGTVSATDVTFRDDAGHAAVYNLSGGSIATYTRCKFLNNSTAVGGDHGTTPSSTSDTESDYTNRTYIVDSVFEGNGHGIRQERFTKINGSTFRNNSYAAYIGGLNRSQILNSTFEGNGTAIGFGNWTPVSWTTVGANNRLVSGNTFSRNTTVFALNDSWDSNQRTQRWTTIINNTWDEAGTWIWAQEWDGTSNVTIAKSTLNSTGVAWTESGNVSSLAVTPPPAVPAPTPPAVETSTTTAPTTSVPSLPVAVASPALSVEVGPAKLPATGGDLVALLRVASLLALGLALLAIRRRVNQWQDS